MNYLVCASFRAYFLWFAGEDASNAYRKNGISLLLEGGEARVDQQGNGAVEMPSVYRPFCRLDTICSTVNRPAEAVHPVGKLFSG